MNHRNLFLTFVEEQADVTGLFDQVEVFSCLACGGNITEEVLSSGNKNRKSVCVKSGKFKSVFT